MRCPRAGETQPPSPGGVGLHPQALGPAARSWLTGVFPSRPKAWPVRRDKDTAVARREAPACFERSMRPGYEVSRLIGAPRPRLHPGEKGEDRLTRGRPNNTGDGARLLVIPGRRGTRRTRNPETGSEQVSGFRVRGP